MKIRTIFAILFWAVPALAQQVAAPATDAERARWTMTDMRSLATAFESFAIDHKEYPKGETLEAIVAAIEPTYIRKAPVRDAWGHPFVYECPDGRAYTIVSLGADGTRDSDNARKPGTLQSYADDAVFSNGQFVRSWAYR